LHFLHLHLSVFICVYLWLVFSFYADVGANEIPPGWPVRDWAFDFLVALTRANYSPTYGSSAMKRARLTALVTACWLMAVQPLLRRLTILPWRLISLPSNSMSL
jgi:hypothetical protein